MKTVNVGPEQIKRGRSAFDSSPDLGPSGVPSAGSWAGIREDWGSNVQVCIILVFVFVLNSGV